MSDGAELVQPMSPVVNASRWRKTLVKIAVTAVLLALLFWQVKWEDVWLAIQNLNGRYFLLVVVLAVPNQYLQFLKWEVLAKEAGPGVTRGDIHRGFWVGYTLGLVTPGRIGQYGRALALQNCSLARAAGLTFIERSYSSIVVNGFGLLTLVFLPMLGWISPFALPGHVVEITVFASGVAILIGGIYPRGLAPLILRFARKLPLGEKLARAIAAIEVVTPARGLWLLTLATSGLACAVLQFVVLLWSLGAPVPLFAGMLAGLLSFFVKGAMPIAIGNLGVGEWTAVLCLSGLGVEPSVAVAASLILFTLNVFLPGLVGLPFVSSLRTPNLSWTGRTAQ
jgi:uncharacterized membrane protein YbhN (UPF0104 family)